jgi:hypothetical protein
MMRDRLRHAGAVLLACAGLAVAPPAASVTEYELKAAFLYNFASFTEWPPGAAPGMKVCILGQDPFGPALDGLQGKTVQGVVLEVRHVNTAAEARACRILFIGIDSADELAAALSALRTSPVLTVADGKDAARRGVMIGLVTEGGRVGFEINTGVTREAGLVLSSKLLRLARQIHPAP